MFWLNKIVWFVANPMTTALALLIFALLSRKARRFSIVLVIALLYFFGTGFGYRVLGWPLEHVFPQMNPADCPICDAIVDLGGGVVKRSGNTTSYPELSSSSDRVYFSALLWKAGRAPIVITSCHNVTNADDVVLRDLGIPAHAIVSENRATTTEENAKYISRLFADPRFPVASHQRPRILLVTSAWHMRRALYMFQKYAPEIECIPAACDFEVMTHPTLRVTDFIPSPSAFELSCEFLHEWLGIIGYHFR